MDFGPQALPDRYREERDTRLRGDGLKQYLDVSGAFERYRDDPYVEPGFTREKLSDKVEVVVIGGGFASVLNGTRLCQAGFERIRIIESAGAAAAANS